MHKLCAPLLIARVSFVTCLFPGEKMTGMYNADNIYTGEHWKSNAWNAI